MKRMMSVTTVILFVTSLEVGTIFIFHIYIRTLFESCIWLCQSYHPLPNPTQYVDSDTIHLPASCIGADDGYQWMKMLDGDEYPAVHQLCNNEYMVIDVNEDPNVIDYFSSFTPWHYALSGPTIMDQGNWEQWWLPSAHLIESVQNDAENEEYYSFTISPECSSCGRANNFERNIYSPWNDDEYGDRNGYYMNGMSSLATHDPYVRNRAKNIDQIIDNNQIIVQNHHHHTSLHARSKYT